MEWSQTASGSEISSIYVHNIFLANHFFQCFSPRWTIFFYATTIATSVRIENGVAMTARRNVWWRNVREGSVTVE